MSGPRNSFYIVAVEIVIHNRSDLVSELPRAPCGSCLIPIIWCDYYRGSSVSAVRVFQYLDASVRSIVITAYVNSQRVIICADWAVGNYRQILMFYFKDAWRAQGCDPSEIRPRVACQAQVSEYSAVRTEYPAFIQSAAPAEEDRRTGEGR